MGDIIFKILYIMFVLPFIIFVEGSKKFAAYLRKKNFYQNWDIYHAFVVLGLVLIVVLWFLGFR